MFGFGKKEETASSQQSSEQQNLTPFYQAGEELGKIMLDSEHTIEKIRMNLLGYISINGEYKQKGKPYMNEKGAGKIASLLDAHIGKEVFLTKIDEEDKVRIARDLWSTLIRLLVKNIDEWELSPDLGDWRAIRAIIINQAYFALCRGVEGIEKDFFRDTHQSKYVTNQSQTQRQPQGGFFG